MASSVAASRDKSGEGVRPRAGSGTAANVTALAQDEGEGGGKNKMVLAWYCESSRRDEEVLCRKTTGSQAGTGRSGLSQTQAYTDWVPR